MKLRCLISLPYYESLALGCIFIYLFNVARYLFAYLGIYLVSPIFPLSYLLRFLVYFPS